ncbi:alpha/beta fold hydrolase [Rhizobium helianthi]|uniref:Alpha/beta fold hydrolase n=1 Tax=Rhizobium helianthi TaxID=1132695 RepID=A0ABW4LZS3_9HYPH
MLKNLSSGTQGTWLAIPGVGSFSASFDPIARSLSALGIGLVAVELMEVFKGSPALQHVDHLADLIVSAVPTLALGETCTVLGHSFGGRIAYELGRRRSLQGLSSRIIMIDALPRNLDGKSEPEGTTLSDGSLLRWYVSTFPEAFARRFADLADADLAAALVSSRIFRKDDIAGFIDAMRRQISAHNAYAPDVAVSQEVRLDVILPDAGSFASTDQALIQKILNQTAANWTVHPARGDHYSILKTPEQILAATELSNADRI